MNASCLDRTPTRSTPTTEIGLPSWELIEAVRARTPRGICVECGESIGAARLTLHPGTALCAWCAPRRGAPVAAPLRPH